MMAGTFSNMACLSLAEPVERNTPESADASENLHFAIVLHRRYSMHSIIKISSAALDLSPALTMPRSTQEAQHTRAGGNTTIDTGATRFTHWTSCKT